MPCFRSSCKSNRVVTCLVGRDVRVLGWVFFFKTATEVESMRVDGLS